MALADRLHACHSSVIHDVMKDLGLPLRVLPRTITGLEPTMRAAGPVFTIRGRPDPTLDKHTSLYEWAGLLSRAPAGHVVVCQPQDDTRALFGGLSAEALKLTARDLYKLGVIDRIIPEPLGGAHRDHREMGNTLKTWLLRDLRDLRPLPVEDLLEQRYQKFRRMGVFDEGLQAVGNNGQA